MRVTAFITGTHLGGHRIWWLLGFQLGSVRPSVSDASAIVAVTSLRIKCNTSALFSYTKLQFCDDTPEWGCNSFSSVSIDFNENRIANVITENFTAALMLTVSTWRWSLEKKVHLYLYIVLILMIVYTIYFVELSEEQGDSQPGVEGEGAEGARTSVENMDTAELLRLAREDDVKSELEFIYTDRNRPRMQPTSFSDWFLRFIYTERKRICWWLLKISDCNGSFCLASRSRDTTFRAEMTPRKGKRHCETFTIFNFHWSLSPLNVNIKLDSLWTHLEAMSLCSFSYQHKQTLKVALY